MLNTPVTPMAAFLAAVGFVFLSVGITHVFGWLLCDDDSDERNGGR